MPTAEEKANALFRSYLTEEEHAQLDRGGFILLKGAGHEEFYYVYRLFPNENNKVLQAQGTGSYEGLWFTCCLEVNFWGVPRADVALTLLLYYRAGGIMRLQDALAGSTHLTSFPQPVPKEEVDGGREERTPAGAAHEAHPANSG